MLNIILLFLITVLWGFGFVASRLILNDFSPLMTHALRFGIAGLFSLPLLLYWQTFTKRGAEFIRFSFIAGSLLTLSMFLQIYGLNFTTVAKNSFITTLYALFVPIMTMVLYKTRHGWHFWPLLFMALFGVAMMCDLSFTNFNKGDFYTLVSAVFFAIHMLYLDKISKYVPSAIEFNFIQCFWVGVIAIAILPLTDSYVNPMYLFERLADVPFFQSSLFGALYSGICASLIAFSIQVYTQKTVSPHVVGLIYLFESPIGAVCGFFFLGETLTTMNIFGALLVTLAIGLLPFFESHAKKKIKC